MALHPTEGEQREISLKEKEEKQEEEIKKQRFIVRWTHAAPEQQAELIWETFSKANHSHALPIRETLFGCS